jgi:NPCBM/NEW2 domain
LAPSEIAYDLTGLNVVTLEGSVGIAPANVNSTMRFEVFGDDKVLWQSGVMTQDPKRPEALVSLAIERRRQLLERLLAAPKIRCACRRSCWPLQDKFWRRCASLAWKVSSANGSALSTNPASDQARGSSTARTWSKSLSLVLHSRFARV